MSIQITDTQIMKMAERYMRQSFRDMNIAPLGQWLRTHNHFAQTKTLKIPHLLWSYEANEKEQQYITDRFAELLCQQFHISNTHWQQFIDYQKMHFQLTYSPTLMMLVYHFGNIEMNRHITWQYDNIDTLRFLKTLHQYDPTGVWSHDKNYLLLDTAIEQLKNLPPEELSGNKHQAMFHYLQKYDKPLKAEHFAITSQKLPYLYHSIFTHHDPEYENHSAFRDHIVYFHLREREGYKLQERIDHARQFLARGSAEFLEKTHITKIQELIYEGYIQPHDALSYVKTFTLEKQYEFISQEPIWREILHWTEEHQMLQALFPQLTYREAQKSYQHAEVTTTENPIFL